jgi:PAN-like domain
MVFDDLQFGITAISATIVVIIVTIIILVIVYTALSPKPKYYAAPATAGYWNPGGRVASAMASESQKLATVDECGKACHKDETCGTFTHNAESNLCELWKLDDAGPNDISTSYIYDKTADHWTDPIKGDWWGWDLNTPHREADAETCKTDCKADKDCSHIMTRAPTIAGQQNCWIKRSIGVDENIRTGIPLRSV